MISSVDKTETNHYEYIVTTVESILRDLDELMENPTFINNIHGEQELSLDQTVELLNNIRLQFLPLNKPPILNPIHEADRIDLS